MRSTTGKPRAPAAPWRALYRYCFKLHTLDGVKITEAEMREWLADNVREHRFEFVDPKGFAMFFVKPSIVYLVHDEDAMMFKMRWGEDLVLHRKDAKWGKIAVAQYAQRQARTPPDPFWLTYESVWPQDKPSTVEFKILKSRSRGMTNMAAEIDLERPAIIDFDRP